MRYKAFGLLLLFLAGMAAAQGDKPAFAGTGWGVTGWFAAAPATIPSAPVPGIQAVTAMLYGIPATTATLSAPSSAPSGIIDWHGLACSKIQRAGHNVWIDNGCTHNLITNNGKNMSVGDLFGVASLGTTNQWTQQALGGNSTPMLATDTALSGLFSTCGLGIAGGTPAYVSNGNVSVAYTWTNSCATSLVNATALYNATNSVLAAEATITAATLNNGDKITVTYYGAQT